MLDLFIDSQSEQLGFDEEVNFTQISTATIMAKLGAKLSAA
jgi:hypothetical protein